MNLDLSEYKAMCCTFSKSNTQHLWIGASKGTLLFYDIPGILCFLLRPTRIFNLESVTSVPIRPPIQCVGHLSGRAGCFYHVNAGADGVDDESVEGLTIMTQAGKVWILEGCTGESTAVPLEFVDFYDSVVVMASCYDVRVVDITASSLSYVSEGANEKNGETRVVACLLVSCKSDLAKVHRFLLHRRDKKWVGVLLSRFSGHSDFMSLPRPIAACIPNKDITYANGHNFDRTEQFENIVHRDLTADRYRNRDMLVVGCPESSGSMRVWVESVKSRSDRNFNSNVVEDYTVQVASTVLSMTFLDPTMDSHLSEIERDSNVIDLRSEERENLEAGTGTGDNSEGSGESGTGTGVEIETLIVKGTGVLNENAILRILATTPERVYLYIMAMNEYDHFVKLNRTSTSRFS